MKLTLKSLPKVLIVFATMNLFVACSDSDVAPSGAEATQNFNTTLNMAELMALVIEPAADVLWDNAGWVESAAGYEELYPTSDEAWNFVRAQSATVAETGNLLALPGRAMDDDAWLVYAQAMVDAGLMAMDAAQRHHKEDFFQAGAQLYSVCSACHQAYNPDILSRFVDGEPQ